MRTVEYARGRFADVYGDPTQPTVLMWHGMQTDARGAFRPLAGMLAGRGAAVVAPDWNSHADDGGRADLLRSLDFAQQRAGEGNAIVLVGWSMGGVAAAAVTLGGDARLAHTVCLAGAFMVPDPIFGRRVTEGLAARRIGTPFTLLHGPADDVVPVAASRDFAAGLRRVGWPVELVELPADHGSIAGADYDRAADRYEPGTSEEAVRVAGEVAARIAATLLYE
ncbi:phospholipase/carboxylesterase [Mycobacterium europaeum]|uniref:Phospholipase/carboxylesterase n=1 Tax=Mycobacterium europaeum TaxID=761804 RepID=A0A0U1DIR6_9MYCO|nr:alpha/beta fold hydrolase [Mycobacterium europaeum]CQD17078.1 phospholipase/carboxylesterase [Mycobacterium europaeum]